MINYQPPQVASTYLNEDAYYIAWLKQNRSTQITPPNVQLQETVERLFRKSNWQKEGF